MILLVALGFGAPFDLVDLFIACFLNIVSALLAIGLVLLFPVNLCFDFVTYLCFAVELVLVTIEARVGYTFG